MGGKHTIRDIVWSKALDLAIQQYRFTTTELLDSHPVLQESNRRTARRVLRTMDDLGWIGQQTPGSRWWHAGVKLSEIPDLADHRVLGTGIKVGMRD